MKILHVITSLQTGGAETLVVNMLPRFVALGHEVGLVIFNGERTALTERLERECPECKLYALGTGYYNPTYILNWLLAKIDRWMYTRYDKIICISDQAEENLRTYLNVNVNNNIITIYNGVEVEAIHNAIPLSNDNDNRFIVVMVAAFRPQKDQDTLIKAMSLLPKDRYELWLVGDGERRSSVECLVLSVGVTDNVRFFGLRTDVPRILKAADVVVMSSHWEGLSLSNIEGMAAGKPFVASDVDGLREVTQGYGILFPHEDAKALADIIKRLDEDKEYYDEVADRCYQRAKEYDLSSTIAKYNKVYCM